MVQNDIILTVMFHGKQIQCDRFSCISSQSISFEHVNWIELPVVVVVDVSVIVVDIDEVETDVDVELVELVVVPSNSFVKKLNIDHRMNS